MDRRRLLTLASGAGANLLLNKCAPKPAEIPKPKSEKEIIQTLDKDIDLERQDPDTELNMVKQQLAHMQRSNPTLLKDLQKYAMIDREEYLNQVAESRSGVMVDDAHNGAVFIDKNGKFVYLFFRPSENHKSHTLGDALPQGIQTLPSKGVILMVTREYPSGATQPVDKYKLTTVDVVRKLFNNNDAKQRPTREQRVIDVISRRFDRWDKYLKEKKHRDQQTNELVYNAVIEANKTDFQQLLADIEANKF